MDSSIAARVPPRADAVRAWRIVVLAGAIAATCDLSYAILYSGWRGVPAMRVMQSVASGLLGKPAFDGGAATAALGVALHYAICIVAAGVYWSAARRLAWLNRHALVAGALFGLGVYGVMNEIVLPLSAFPFKPHPAALTLATGLVVHMAGVGVPIALLTRRGQRSASS